MREKILIKKAKAKDKDALIKLIMLKQNDFYGLAFSYMKNEEDAMDALQDMIIILFENIKDLRTDLSFYSWSKTILVNICKSKLKKKEKIVYMDKIIEDSVEENKDENIFLDQIINSLDDIYKDVINLRYILDYDYKEIANILNIPLGTVKSRLNKAKSILKESLKEEKLC